MGEMMMQTQGKKLLQSATVSPKFPIAETKHGLEMAVLCLLSIFYYFFDLNQDFKEKWQCESSVPRQF